MKIYADFTCIQNGVETAGNRPIAEREILKLVQEL